MHYDRLVALRSVSVTVAPKERVAVLGGNGAGKTTLLGCLAGVVRYSGRCRFGGAPLEGLGIRPRMAMGIGLVPEGRPLLGQLSVEDNLRLGGSAKRWLGARQVDLAAAYDVFPLLYDRRKQQAGSLSGGQQQMLSIGRVLVVHPRVLLLDEPSLGLSPVAAEGVVDALKLLNEGGLALLVAEQNVDVAMMLTDRAYVLARGEVLYQGATGSALEQQMLQAADIV